MARADVALRVNGAAAKRAGWPPRGEHRGYLLAQLLASPEADLHRYGGVSRFLSAGGHDHHPAATLVDAHRELSDAEFEVRTCREVRDCLYVIRGDCRWLMMLGIEHRLDGIAKGRQLLLLQPHQGKGSLLAERHEPEPAPARLSNRPGGDAAERAKITGFCHSPPMVSHRRTGVAPNFPYRIILEQRTIMLPAGGFTNATGVVAMTCHGGRQSVWG